jgi:4-aminobutyrate aminotransferase-like enzyme
MHGNIIRFLPALTISEILMNEGLSILQDCFDSLA